MTGSSEPMSRRWPRRRRVPFLASSLTCSASHATLLQQVVYGGMNEQDVKGLFTKFKQDFRRSYAEDEEETRFALFKENLETIDFYNRYNPLALFGITDAADMTQDERSQRKMKSEWSNYEQIVIRTVTSHIPAPNVKSRNFRCDDTYGCGTI